VVGLDEAREPEDDENQIGVRLTEEPANRIMTFDTARHKR